VREGEASKSAGIRARRRNRKVKGARASARFNPKTETDRRERKEHKASRADSAWRIASDSSPCRRAFAVPFALFAFFRGNSILEFGFNSPAAEDARATGDALKMV